MSYEVSFKITNEMVSLVASITEKIGTIKHFESLNKFPKLRRQNRIRSIHSSCAIEANSLSLDQVKDIINGKVVFGPQKEIQEVKNAIEAYSEIDNINPFLLEDILLIHRKITMYLVDNPGSFRKGEEGVFDAEKCIFIAPPAKYVAQHMNDLLKWLNENKNIIHPLILSSIFHYEFVFIHPFEDGNGRTARLLQSAILGKYYPIFYWLPLENFIKDYQEQYYNAISKSHKEGESTKFVIFMLEMISKTLDDVSSSLAKQDSQNSIYVKKLMSVMEDDEFMTALEIMNLLKLKSKETFRKYYMNPAIENGLVRLEFPDKPTSKNQRYIKINN